MNIVKSVKGHITKKNLIESVWKGIDKLETAYFPTDKDKFPQSEKNKLIVDPAIRALATRERRVDFWPQNSPKREFKYGSSAHFNFYPGMSKGEYEVKVAEWKEWARKTPGAKFEPSTYETIRNWDGDVFH